ncbi:glycosyl hydrolase family 26 [Vibrio sp. TRT 17S01]|uniref:glycosyl hydrolase family 26 n=1 Tax=Vibrio sp. TRT 17S01 TaxID=3418505 RepID=UPI003CF3ACF3
MIKSKIVKMSLLALCITMVTACSEDSETMSIREQVSTVDIEIDNEGVKPEVIYTTNVNSQAVYCGSSFNGIEQFNNLKISSGTMSLGYNPTAFLQPGENTLELWTLPLGVHEGNLEYQTDNKCSVLLFGAFPDGKKVEMSSLSVTIEDGKPTTKASTIYPDNNKTPLNATDGVLDGKLTDFSRTIYIKTIPRWRWVDATPIREDNPEQMKALYRAYTNLIELMKKQDFEGLKMAWSLSMREKAKAEAYFVEPEDFYYAVDFEGGFNDWDDAAVRPRRDWSEYKLRSYLGGRLVKLEDMRFHSPLRIGSTKNDLVYSPTPLFSMIDGRVVVSR